MHELKGETSDENPEGGSLLVSGVKIPPLLFVKISRPPIGLPVQEVGV